jgi:hypothetical protein
MRRALCTLLLAVFATAVAVSAAAAQTPAEEPRIRAGVTVSGVDVGTLTVAEATAKLEAALGPVLAEDVVVTVARRTFTLRMAAIDYDFRGDRTALRALYAGQAAPPLPDGTLPPASAEPSVAYKRAPVWEFVRKVAKRVDVAPRDARLKIKLTRMVKRPSRKGHKLRLRALVKAIGVPLADPLAARALKPERDTIVPKVRTKQLKRLYPKVITIDRAHFRLRLFRRLHFLKRYGVAVGMPAYPTPTGLFAIQSKQVNPTWTAPNSPWAGEMAGQQIAGGAWNNPLRARWMGVDGSVGIHGTGQPWTIGTRASHGCIRMTVPDVIDLFRRVAVGTPVLIR